LTTSEGKAVVLLSTMLIKVMIGLSLKVIINSLWLLLILI